MKIHLDYLAKKYTPEGVERIRQIGVVGRDYVEVDLQSPEYQAISREHRRSVHPAHEIPEGFEPTSQNAVEGGCDCA